MKCSAIVEIAQMVTTEREVFLVMEYFTAFGEEKKRAKRQGKAIFKKYCFMISCMCTNRVCGVGEMRRREREKRREGREEGIFR